MTVWHGLRGRFLITTLLLRERVSLERWAAALVGFAGMLVVIAPHWQRGAGSLFWSIVLLGSSPLFAASALITKALTRRDRPEVIVVWQCITISLFSLPLAIPGDADTSPGASFAPAVAQREQCRFVDVSVVRLDDYRVLIITTHPEYWSRSMYDAVKRWVFERGGRLGGCGGCGRGRETCR